jgi:TRAP-type C4-dicarboxylate transport system substrate-binding protein
VRKTRSIASMLGVLLGVVAWTSGEAQVVIKLGTIAPEGSIWHDLLLQTRQQWRVIRKMQRRGLDALAVSGSGLPLIDNIVECLHLPMLFGSYQELKMFREDVAEELEDSVEQRGYKILSWTLAGWVHFFAKSPVHTPDDLRSLRLWTAAGAPEQERLFKQFGFRVVPLPATDMLTGLQTGLIEAIDVPPLFALLDRSYQAAPYMTALPFAPLNGATVITLSAWNGIAPAYRDRLLSAARSVADDFQQDILDAEDDAVDEMVARGLNVVPVDAQAERAWREVARSAYRDLSCARQHPELFERLLRLQRQWAERQGPH